MLRIICASLLALLSVGCATEFNRTPTKTESDSLTDIVQLTRGFDRAGEAYFSPDMQWVIFQASRNDDPRYQMFVAPLIHADKGGMPRLGEPIQISPANSRNTCGFFSPDGLSLIFASTAGKEVPGEATAGYQRQGGYKWEFPRGMEMFRADGWEPAIRHGGTNLAQHALTHNDAYDAECAYSPDGSRIVFTSDRSGDPELYVMDADGKNVKRLTNSPGYDGGPFFSPDGKSIVWRTDRKKKDLLQIHVADLVGDRLENERALTNGENVNWAPYWHPDGQHLVYTTSLHGHQNYEVYLMRRDGKAKTRLTHENGFDGLPVISPDGKYLMWSSKRSGSVQVHLARLRLPKGS